MQYQRLAQEMQDAAVAGLIQRRPRIKASRSLPAIVMKPAPKPRVRKEHRTKSYAKCIKLPLYGMAIPLLIRTLCMVTEKCTRLPLK